MTTPPFVHLQVHSAFSFGDGASGVGELVLRAADTGMHALAITDTHSVSAIPGLVGRCHQAGLMPIAGAEVQLANLGRLLLRAADTGTETDAGMSPHTSPNPGGGQ